MSGRKQHFIPQALLRGFARETRGVHKLWVHHRDHGSFASNAHDVGASRDFYSTRTEPGGPPTLDDRITTHENHLGEDLARLRQAPDGLVARPDVARQVVTHLAFRTEAMRDLTSEAILVTQRLKTWMTQPSIMLRYIGADGRKPGERFEAFLEIMRADPRWTARFGRMPARRVRKLLFETVRNEPVRFAGGMMEEAADEMAFLLREHREIARQAHSEALAEDVASNSAAKGLDGLEWSVVDYAADLPLPDTVVLASGDGRVFNGLLWTSSEERRTVIMPLNHGRLLQGTRDGPRRYEPAMLCDALVRGSSAFAVTRDPVSRIDLMTIGQANAVALDRIVADATSDLFSRPLRRFSRAAASPAA